MERPPAFLPGASGELFAREVERADERARGDGLREQRLEALEGERRSARHASFGGGRSAGETSSARDPAPPGEEELEAGAAAPSPRAVPQDLGPEPAPSASGERTAGSGPLAKEGDLAPAPAGAPAPTAEGPIFGTAGLGAPGVASLAAPPVAAPAPPGEARPLELQGLRPVSERAPRAGAPAEPSPGPDTTMLERAQEVLRQIRLHLAPGVRRLTLDLEPGELGRLAIQLTSRQGKVSAIVRAERGETLELLRLGEDDLRAILAERGIETDSVRLELGFDGGRAHAGAGRERAWPGASASARERAPDSAPDHAPGSLHRPSTSLVDTYA